MTRTVERIQDKLYHDIFLPEETTEIRVKAREFADRIIAPKAFEIVTTKKTELPMTNSERR
jgi:hypothetical protein